MNEFINDAVKAAVDALSLAPLEHSELELATNEVVRRMQKEFSIKVKPTKMSPKDFFDKLNQRDPEEAVEWAHSDKAWISKGKLVVEFLFHLPDGAYHYYADGAWFTGSLEEICEQIGLNDRFSDNFLG